MKAIDCDVVIIGAGIVGIATAYYLKKLRPDTSVILLESDQPMALTSAQSGENYRNWWPHPVMTAFTDRSIDLMESLSIETNNHINMNRRGYALCTRSNDVQQLLDELDGGYADLDNNAIRFHNKGSAESYQPPESAQWQTAPSGVDVLSDRNLIRKTFPSFDSEIKTVVHIRRAGAISAQQMGQLMLDRFRQAGGQTVRMQVSAIDSTGGFLLTDTDMQFTVKAQQLINAAGPFINDIAHLLGTELPVENTLQQKIAFEDTQNTIPRKMPFSIDLDRQYIDWNDEEIALLKEGGEHRDLIEEMPGSIHCRPDGGDNGRWVKLGWAFNESVSVACREPQLSDSFPEIVLRGAARLNSGLKKYYGKFPRHLRHYGGYYTLTRENWPLIGQMEPEGAFVVGALSGFGTMAACAAGELCALACLNKELPHYAHALSPQRYDNTELMLELNSQSARGIL